MVDERGQLIGQRRAHDGEAIDCAGILPGDDVVGQLLGRADEL